MFEDIINEIRTFDRIIIFRHTNPDGDALGAQIGLKHIIKQNFPSKEVYCVGDEAKRYSFMEDSVMDDIPDALFCDSLSVILDCGASSLISDKRYSLSKKTARIDHHIFCEKIADTEFIDTSFESCCGEITALAMEGGLSVPSIAAKSLYTGMVTDSGRFRYDSTTERTFALASFLMKQNINISSVYAKLYADDLDSVKLRASFTLRIQLTSHNVAYIYTTAEELKETGADSFTASRGMVGTMSSIKNVPIWVNFTEADESVLCEIRSSVYNINPIAVKYGGGGHAKASGATVKSREEAMNMLSDLDNMITGEDQ